MCNSFICTKLVFYNHVAAGKVISSYSSTNLKRCAYCCVPIATIIFIAILTITVFWNIPNLSKIITYTPSITAPQNVIEIMLEPKAAFLVAEASISVNNCDSNVVVVQGRSCSNLPTKHGKGGGYDLKLHLRPIYYLEKSIINISVINNNVGPNASMWILNKKDYFDWSKHGGNIKQECDSFHECPRHAAEGESCCYHTQNYVRRNISHEIMKPGFYFAIPQPFTNTSYVSYTAVAYDLDAIIQLPGAKVFKRSTKISDWFKFHSTKCILLNTTFCPANIEFGASTITISNISKRKDVLVLALIVEIVVSIVIGTGLVVLCNLTLLKGRWSHAKRHGTNFDELEPSDATALMESTSEKIYNITISTSTNN